MLKKLEWESKILDVKIANFNYEKLKDNKFEIANKIDNKEIEFIQSTVDINDCETINFLENNGFHFEDLKISMKMNIHKEWKDYQENYEIADKNDIKIIKNIAKELFYYSRFNIFGNEKAKEIYEIWAEKAIYGEFDDVCFKVLDKDNKDICGFLTLKKTSNNEARIGIIAVEFSKQNSGYGKKLINSVKKYLAENDINKFYIVTQGKNIKAQNFYHRVGFFMEKIEMWYYKDLR